MQTAIDKLYVPKTPQLGYDRRLGDPLYGETRTGMNQLKSDVHRSTDQLIPDRDHVGRTSTAYHFASFM